MNFELDDRTVTICYRDGEYWIPKAHELVFLEECSGRLRIFSTADMPMKIFDQTVSYRWPVYREEDYPTMAKRAWKYFLRKAWWLK